MLRINNIFESISGEAGGFPQGTWITGIRLQGCNLSCKYCDTPQGQDKKDLCYEMKIPAILKMTRNKHVLITGGEPLTQEKELINLIGELQKNNHLVQVETNGSLQIPICPGVHWVIDRKCPFSGMEKRMLPIESFIQEIIKVQAGNGYIYIKWVVGNKEDVNFAIQEIKKLLHNRSNFSKQVPFIISPIDARGDMITDIVARIFKVDYSLLDYLIFSVQLHKILNML